MSTPYHVRLAVSQYGEQFRVELFTEDLGDTEGDLLVELPPSIAEWTPYLAQGADLPPDAARQLGKDLFAALLGQPENAKKWAEVISQAARKKQPIRLLIDATSESVRDLPYGLMCEPHDDWFLFRGTKTPVEFVRILRRCSPRPLKLRDRLRVLIAVAEPKSSDVPPFDGTLRLQKLAAAIHKDVDLMICGSDGPRPYVEFADPTAFLPATMTTREALRKALMGDYDVFHLLAHGHGAGVLLCKDDGTPAETTASELGEWCGAGRTSLAFLQVCKAGQTAGRGGFGGVAQQLLNPRGGNLAAVVASTFPLDAEDSTHAAIGFYHQLAAGKPPEEAITAERPESDWCWAFLELWARPGALGGGTQRAAFQFVSPYRGLSSFGEQDADLFFGRKSEVAELMQILRTEPAVAVVGDSGSGKTSLLQAGLVHAVRREGLAGSDKWRLVSLRPGYRPAQSLLAAIFGGTKGESMSPDAQTLRSALRATDQPLMIVFDQFEEVFTLARDKAEVQLLTNALAEAVEHQRDRFRLVIGMRSEFLGQAASIPGLSRLIRRPWVLRPPARDDIREIIGGPAEHCGYTFQRAHADENPEHAVGLLDRILADPLLASDQGGLTAAPLPLLQFALERLWLKAVEKGLTEFTHAEFDAIGGMGKAIAQHAEAVFQATPTATEIGAVGRTLAEQIITALVSTQGTRQPRGREALQAETGSPDATRTVIDYLVGERLLTVRSDPEDMTKSLVDLSHEALIHNWDRLRGWLSEDPQGRAMREEFRKAAEQWESGFAGVQPRSRYGLPGADVARNYLAWIATSKPKLAPVQQDFTSAMHEMLVRSRRRRQLVMGSLVALAVVSTGLAIYADNQAGRAKSNEAAAKLSAEASQKSEADAIAARNDAVVSRNDAITARNEIEKVNDLLVTKVARLLLRTLATGLRSAQWIPGLNDPEIAALWEVSSAKDKRLPTRFVGEVLNNPGLMRQLSDRAAFAFQAAVGLDNTRRVQVEAMLGQEFQAKETSKEQKEDVAICLGNLGIADPRLAEQVVATLIQALSDATDQYRSLQLMESLLAMAARIEPKAAADAIKQAIDKTPNQYVKLQLVLGQSAIADRMEPTAAAKFHSQRAESLNENIGQVANVESNATRDYAVALAAVAVRLDPNEAKKLCGQAAHTLIKAMSMNLPPQILKPLAEGFLALVPHIDPIEAKKVCGQAAAILVNLLSTDDPFTFDSRPLAEILSTIVTTTEPNEAATRVTEALMRSTQPVILAALSQSVIAIAPTLEPKSASGIAARLVQIIQEIKFQDFYFINSERIDPFDSILKGLSAVVGRLEPKEAAETAAALNLILSKSTSSLNLGSLARSLSAVAARLEPKQAAKVCSEAVAILEMALSKSTDSQAVGALAVGLSDLTSRLDPNEAARVRERTVVALKKALKNETNPLGLRYLLPALSAMTGPGDSKETTKIYNQAALMLNQAMSKLTEPASSQTLLETADFLKVVATRLEANEAAQACDQAVGTLLLAMRKQPAVNVMTDLSERLSVLTAFIGPRDAAMTLILVLSKLNASNAMELPTIKALTVGLAAVLAHKGSPLPPQLLADLLKFPFCVGDARRFVLDQLTRHYQKHFADQWEFVDYVQKNKLILDLTTPIERPGLLP